MTTGSETSDIQTDISAITKIFRKYHLNYDQIHYITKVARKNLAKDDQKKVMQVYLLKHFFYRYSY